MADIFELNASARTQTGKAAARRMRRLENNVPGIVYGAGEDPQPIFLSHNELIHALDNEAVYSHILTLKLDGKTEKVVIKAIDRHAFKPAVLHIDFMRVSTKDKLTMNVPLHYINEESAPGIKEGGVPSKLLTEVAIRCLPADLPEFIELDVSGLDIGDALHMRDIKLPKGVEHTVELDEDHDQAIYSIHAAKVEAEEEADTEAEGEAGSEDAASDAESSED